MHPSFLRNTVTPRVFIAATRMNDGKTTSSLGLVAALQKHYPRIGYIKPVGQRFVEIEESKIDEDTVLMNSVYQLRCPLADMSPIAVEPDFTKKYLMRSNRDELVKRIQDAFDRVAWEKDFVLCEGSGHAGVGSVFDLSNAQVAKLLGAKVVIVTHAGIGRPIDEVALNQALFEKERVDIIGVIINKAIPEKIDYITDLARRGLERKGLELLGVLPHQPVLRQPTMELIREDLGAEVANSGRSLLAAVENVVVGAMGVQHLVPSLLKGTLILTPCDREDIILATATALVGHSAQGLAGMVLTGSRRLSPTIRQVAQELPFPVLLAEEELYQVASRVHDITVKTRPSDTHKISLIRDLIAKHVNVDRILQRIRN
jgi:hypothetical protein